MYERYLADQPGVRTKRLGGGSLVSHVGAWY
jgi:hypothetical protein